MSSYESPIRLRPAEMRRGQAPVASAAQIVRAVLAGLLLAFFFVWALPQARLLLASSCEAVRSEVLA